VASKKTIEKLKRRYRGRLLRLPGVSGLGVERGKGEDDYILVVHVKEDDELTRAAVLEQVEGGPVRIVPSGTFRKF
jgi:hypothetical protein